MNRSDTSRRAPNALLALVAASTIIRLGLAATTGLGVDESYAVSVALPYSLSYFDHPPLHFWMAGLMVQLTGSTDALLVRLPFVLCFSLTLWAIGTLGTRLFGARAGFLGALALAMSGVLGVTTGTWVLPDGPLVAALAVAALQIERVTREPERAIGPWLRLGVVLALALMSKYHAALFGAGFAFFLLTDPTARRAWRSPGPWLAGVVALLGVLPVLVWNARHDWASFAFHGARAQSDRPWSPAPFAEMLGGETAWLLPWVAVPAAVALWRAWRAGPRDRGQWLCATLATGAILTFSLLPLGGARGLPHWTAPGWLFVMPLIGRLADRALDAGRVWPRRWAWGGTGATVALALLLVAQVRTGVLRIVAPALDAPSDPTLDAVDWRPLADALASRGLADVPLYARSWIQAGKLGVALGPTATVDCLCDDPHHFAYRRSRGTSTHGAILVEHAQPWRRQWQPAHRVERPGVMLDSIGAITFTPSGARSITLLLHRVRRTDDQLVNRRVNRNLRESDTSDREIDA